MPNFKVGTTALFKLDDTPTPGLARVRLIKPVQDLRQFGKGLIWRVEVLETVKASTAGMKSVAKPGQKKDISESLMTVEG